MVFVPISIRFGTATERPFFPMLAARLAEAHHEKLSLPPDKSDDPIFCRALAQELLNKPLAGDRRLLVIIDGLDEAVGWSFGASFFPLRQPQGQKIIVSAREQAGDTGPRAWFRWLNWDTYSGIATSLSLNVLTRTGISDVLIRMNVPISGGAYDAAVLDELQRLTEGDPLLVRLYVEDLWTLRTRIPELRPEHLKGLAKGYQGYFEKWIEDQRSLWQGQSRLDERPIRLALSILACAKGPLSRSDLRQVLIRCMEGFEGATNTLIDPMRRFVVGDGTDSQGYVLSHPKLAEYFRSSAFLEEDEIRAVEQAFLKWGHETIDDLERASGGDVSPYLVQFFGLHLLEKRPEHLINLVRDCWRRTWAELEGGYGGFATDVRRAWAFLKQVANTAGTHESNIGDQLRCSLCLSSIASLGSNVRPRLVALALAVEEGTSGKALSLIRNKLDPSERAATLSELVKYVSFEFIGTVILQAVAAIRTIEQEDLRARSLLALLDCLPPKLSSETEAAAWQSLSLIETLRNAHWRARLLLALLPRLTADNRLRAIAEFIGAAKEDTAHTPRWITRLSPYLPRQPQPNAAKHLESLLDIVRSIQNEESRFMSLAALTHCLPQHSVRIVFREALAAAIQVRRSRTRDYLLKKLLTDRPSSMEQVLIDDALTIARTMRPGMPRCEVMISIAKECVEDKKNSLLEEAFSEAKNIENDESRARVVLELINSFPSYTELAIEVVLSSTSLIRNEAARSEVIHSLLECAPMECERHFQKLLVMTWTLESETLRAKTLFRLSSHAPTMMKAQLSNEVIRLIRGLQSPAARARTCIELLRYATEDIIVEEATKALRLMPSTNERSELLISLMSIAPNGYRSAIFDDAMAMAHDISDSVTRAHLLCSMILSVPNEQRVPLVKEALSLTQALSDEESKTTLFCQLSPFLNIKQRQEIRSWVLAKMETIGDRQQLATSLVAVLAASTEPQRSKKLADVLAEVRQLQDRHAALRMLVPLLKLVSSDLVNAVLRDVFSLLRSGEDPENNALLFHVLEQIPVSLRSRYFGEAIDVISRIEDEETRINMFISSTRYATVEQGSQALKLAFNLRRSFESEYWQTAVRFIHSLPPDLVEVVVERAASVLEKSGDREKRSVALMRLVPYFPKQKRNQVLRKALSIAGKRIRNGTGRSADPAHRIYEARRCKSLITVLEELSTQTLKSIVRFDTRKVADEALSLARKYQSNETLGQSLIKLCNHFGPRRRQAIIQEALTIARSLTEVEARVRLLTDCVRVSVRNRQAVAEEALVSLQNIANEGVRLEAFRRWIVLLFGPLKSCASKFSDQVVATAFSFRDADESIVTLIPLLEILPSDRREQIYGQIVVAIKSIEDARKRTSMLIRALDKLSGTLRRDAIVAAISAIEEIESEFTQDISARELVQAAPDASSLLLPLALRLKGKDNYSRLLPLLIPNLPESDRQPMLSKILDEFADSPRAEALEILSGMLPAIHQIGGDAAVSQTWDALQDAGRWWP